VSQTSRSITRADVLDLPKGQFVTEPHQGDPCLEEEQHHEEVEKHPLVIWTSLSPGDVVSLRGHGTEGCVGTVESRTSDGLIIWIRDGLNERRLFHFRECQSIRVIP
jgi:hypothetical protein